MVGCHHRLNGHGFGQTPVVGDGQGGLACCGSQVRKELDTTERLNSTDYCEQVYGNKMDNLEAMDRFQKSSIFQE